MPQVQTATGPIDTADLGQTLMHEHVAMLSHSVRANVPGAWDPDAVAERCAARLRDVMQRGVRTIVDLSTVDLERDVALVADAARRSGCQIIVATGCWWRPPAYFASAPIEWLVELWTREITEGIAGTGIRAGIIKLATDREGVTPAIEKMLRAGARTHRATGVPISTHTDVSTRRGEDQQRIFAEEGVDLSRIVIGHSGDSTDLDYLKGLIARGSTIGMDRFGLEGISPFEARVDVVAALCREGYAGQMVLSHDASAEWGGFPGVDNRAARMPHWHYNHIHDDVLPALRERGVTEQQIQQMLVDNPRRIFERQGAY
ncbi:MAG TPA: phosphotriesterase-related protein [Dehalococcoidia bacterium]|nr:phosphotriesterase-related protein [Dehalococcoidia bacterium]